MRQLVTFRTCSRVAFGITAALFVVLLVYPAAVFALFAIEDAASAAFIARRAAVVFLGLATLLWLGQNAPPSATRSAVSGGLAVMMLGLAVLGTVEWARGAAGPGIGLAIVAEALLGGAFASVWRVDRAAP